VDSDLNITLYKSLMGVSSKQTQRANCETFLKAFEKQPDQLPEPFAGTCR
jgi:hypothetical protein